MAIDSARDDYRNVSKQREIKDTLPIAWRKLIDEKEELLLELLADKVESLCGYKPEFELVENFLEKDVYKRQKYLYKPFFLHAKFQVLSLIHIFPCLGRS